MPTPSDSEYRTIPLTQGQFAIVDPADFDWLSQHKWYATYSRKTNSFYAARDTTSKPRKHLYMHREILGLGAGDKRQGDHIQSGQTLDNRRANLRISSPAQNAQNQRAMRNNKSGVKGVCYKKRRNIWEANICVNRKQIFLGSYACMEDARNAYAEAALKYHGEFANLG